MGFIKDAWDGLTGKTASKAASSASATQAQSQTEALEYLKEIDRLPQQFKEQALTKLAGGYGLEGGEGSQQQLIDQARQSPLYASIMGGQQAGEEAILRTGSATGMLRSGNAIDAIADDAEQRQNQALLQSFNQQTTGLQGFAGLPTNEQSIASGVTEIGKTQAQGITAAAQAEQQGITGTLGLGLKAAGLFI